MADIFTKQVYVEKVFGLETNDAQIRKRQIEC